MNRVAVINVVGLSERVVGESTPCLSSKIHRWGHRKITPILPALTCSTQSTYLTGAYPSSHGIIGNGWYFRELSQVHFWRQSNALVQGEKIWEAAKRLNSEFTCANLFWWFNQYSSVNFSVTPRPIYRADGLKIPDIDAEPAFLREQLQKDLGPFPLYQFWGPGANIRSSQWISAAAQWIEEEFEPTLSLIYLPHLDYCLQREGPLGKGVSEELKKIDRVVADLVGFFYSQNVQVIILSEYGVSDVHTPVPLNRVLREKGFLKVRTECGEDHFDAGRSAAFAVCDHQIAHIYVKDPSQLSLVRADLERLPGVEGVLDRAGQASYGLNHERSGDLVAVASPGFWFSYEFWLDSKRAPDYARTVDIHRKPGYDPAELFIDRQRVWPQLRVAMNLAKKQLGFRYLMDVVPPHGHDVRGSHGRSAVDPVDFPLFISDQVQGYPEGPIDPLQIKTLILNQIFASKEREVAYANDASQ